MNLHEFKVKAIDGSVYDMAELSGKKVLVVNVASECGLTPQYEQLQELYEQTDRNRFDNFGSQSR